MLHPVRFLGLSVFALSTLLAIRPAAQAQLIAQWNFDEGSGTTAFDSVGGYDGTISGATWTTDRFGNEGSALQFGDNKWVNIPDTLKPTTITLMGWIYVTNTGVRYEHVIFSAETGSGASGFCYRLHVTSAGTLRMEAVAPEGSSGARVATSSTVLDLNRWYHVAGTYDGHTAAVYIDGNLDASNYYTTAANLPTTASTGVAIGNLQSRNIQWFYGSMDDMRIYSSALSASEIAAIAVPEPATLALIMGAVTGLLVWVRRRRA